MLDSVSSVIRGVVVSRFSNDQSWRTTYLWNVFFSVTNLSQLLYSFARDKGQHKLSPRYFFVSLHSNSFLLVEMAEMELETIASMQKSDLIIHILAQNKILEELSIDESIFSASEIQSFTKCCELFLTNVERGQDSLALLLGEVFCKSTL